MLEVLTLLVLIPINVKATKRTSYTIVETARRAICLNESANLIPVTSSPAGCAIDCLQTRLK